MRQALDHHQKLERRLGQQDQLERAVLVVGLPQPVEGEQDGQQRHHPDHAGADPRQDVGRGADAEREQRQGDDEEGEAHAAVGQAPAGQGEIAAKQGGQGLHGTQPAKSSR